MIATRGPRQANGLYDIYLDAWQNKNYLGRIIVNSGVASNQVFTTVPTATPGTYQPCPEGEFDLGGLEWCGRKADGTMKKGDYKTWYQEIDSPIWVMIMRRRAIGFHLDGNRTQAPGSAGCLVFKDMNDLKKFVRWYDFGEFSKLYVDWGKGYVNIPADLRALKAKVK